MLVGIYWCQPCTFLCLTLDEASDEDDQDESDGEDGEKGDEECDENDTVECNENGDEEGNVEGKYSGGEMEQPKDLYREAVTQVVTQTVTRRLSCDKPDDDKKFDSKVTRSDGDTDGTAEPDVNVADGTEENENTEHEGGTTETSAATSVVTGKNVCHTVQRVGRSCGVVRKYVVRECVGRV